MSQPEQTAEAKCVLIAMSGGVDSSAAAWLLRAQGYQCVGAMMKLYTNEDIGVERERGCCSLSDTEDARAVAFALGMPFYVFNFSDSFAEQVIDRFVAAYRAGETPNPCIDCNRYLKFERFLRRAEEMEMDFIATGHYARVEYDTGSGRHLLKKGIDETRDQSYVLYAMTQPQLARTLLPLGGLRKSEVRAIAAEQGLVNAQKRDSQDICFVPDGNYAEFIATYTGTPAEPGRFVDAAGNDLGAHKGILHYTVGQRKGLGLALPAPLYVRAIEPDTRAVVLASNAELYSQTLTARDLNLIVCDRFDAPIRARAKIRYSQPEQPVTVRQLDDDTLQITFDQPQRAITAGQAVVLYDGDTVLGGGTIARE